MPFFVEDYRWTSANYQNMAKRAEERASEVARTSGAPYFCLFFLFLNVFVYTKFMEITFCFVRAFVFFL